MINYFRRFLTLFCEHIGVFLENQGCDPFLHKLEQYFDWKNVKFDLKTVIFFFYFAETL
jgi:hypothetical protein